MGALTLLGNLRVYAIVGVVLTLLAGWLYVGHLRGEVGKAREQRDQARAELARCQSNRATLEAAIKAQNAELEKARKASDDLRKASEALTRSEAKARQDAQTASTKLRNVRLSGDACRDMEAVDRAVRESLGR